jgi:hypothetical protein
LRPKLKKKKKLGVMVHASYPSYSRKNKEEDSSRGPPRQKVRTYLKNNQCRKSWRYDSSTSEKPLVKTSVLPKINGLIDSWVWWFAPVTQLSRD